MSSITALIAEAKNVMNGELPPLVAHSGLLLMLLSKAAGSKSASIDQITPSEISARLPNIKAAQIKINAPFPPHVAQKHCSRCMQTLPWEKFYRSRVRAHGLSAWCISCNSISATERARRERQQRNETHKSAFIEQRSALAIEMGVPSTTISAELVALSIEAHANRKVSNAARRIGREIAQMERA